MQPDEAPGGLSKKKKASGKPHAIKKRPQYIKLKNPSDVMAYVQRLVNRLREDDKEIEQLGKITNLLNTWISAHKDHVETEELKKLREEIEEMQEKMKKE